MGETLIQNSTLIMLVMYIAQITSMLLAPKIGNLGDKINQLYGMIVVSFLGAGLTLILINLSNPIIFAILLIMDFTLGVSGMIFAQNLFSRISIKHRGKKNDNKTTTNVTITK